MTMGDDDFQLNADPSKYVTLPVQNEKLWSKYQMTLDSFWTVYDIDLDKDRNDMLKTYDSEERQCLLQLIAFMFATHQTTITKELFMQLMSQVEIKEASYYFGSQADAKKTHTMMYSMLLDELMKDNRQGAANKDKLMRDLLSMETVREFIRWSIKSTTLSDKSFAQRLFALAALQGIVFAGTIMIFKWLQKQHPSSMPGLHSSNKLVCRDEILNLSFSCDLFQYIDDELTQDEANCIVQEAVAHAKQILIKSIRVSKLGLSDEMIDQYIEHSADKLLSAVHLSTSYNKDCPFDWSEEPQEVSVVPVNNPMDLSASFADAKFDADLDF